MNLIPENYKEVLPPEIIAYITYVKMLSISDRVDYDFIKTNFKAGLSRHNVSLNDSRYEWVNEFVFFLNKYMNEV